MKTNSFFILVFAFFIQCSGQERIFKSAVYDDGLVEVLIHGDSISGILSLNDEIDCRLLFYGKLLDDEITPITIVNTADLTDNIGSITIRGEDIILKSDNIIFPCQRVIDLNSGVTFTYTKEAEQTNYQYNVISVEKCLLYSTPGKLTTKRSYLIQGDIVKILLKKSQWVKINFNSKIYWVDRKDLKF